jgi:tetratricopeptide (TPR) repeat protein
MRVFLCALLLIVVASPPVTAQTSAFEACDRAQGAQARLTACAAFLAAEPNDQHQIFIAHLRRGTAFLMMNDPTSAVAEYNLLLSLQPENHWGFANRGLARFHLNDFDGAISDTTRSIELGAVDAGVFATRASSYHQKGDVAAAMTDANRALELNPNNILALATRGSIRQTRGEWQDALADFTRATQRSPREPFLHADLASVLVDMGRYREAGNALTAAIALDPNNAEFFRLRAETHARGQDFRVALADLDTALRLAPDDPRTLLLRAFMHEIQGDFARADPDTVRAIALAPDMAEALVGVGRMRWRAGDAAGALEAYGRAIAVRPDYEIGFYQRAELSTKLGQFDDALADLERAIALGAYADAHNARGFVRMRLGDFPGARADLALAVQLAPSNTTALHNWAWLHLLQDEHAAAIEIYSRLIASGYAAPGAYVERALAYWLIGDMTAARADIARAQELDEDNYYAARADTLFSSAAPDTDPEALSAHGALLLYLDDLTGATALADRAHSLHPDSLGFSNQRCWARAVAGLELGVALEACNAALAEGNRASILDSRALVFLKLGRFQDAWNDFNTAVGMSAENPHYLYGRGVAALHLGRQSEGRADLERAASMDGEISLEYAANGVRPDRTN